MSCRSKSSLESCLSASGILGYLFPVGSSDCAWAFRQDISNGDVPVDTPGFCFSFPTDLAPSCGYMDRENELQANSPIRLNGANPFPFSEWIVASTHQCMEYATMRTNVTRPSIIYLLANFLPFGLYLMSVLVRKFGNVADADSASKRWNSKWCIMRPACMKTSRTILIRAATLTIVLTAAFAASIAWSDTDNVSLLPLFAVISLGMEGIHTMPRLTAATPLRAPAWLSRLNIGCSVSGTAQLWLRRVMVLLGSLVAPLLFAGPLVALLAAGYGLDNPFETQAVKRIAWMDVYMTFSFGLCTALGINHNHYKLSARWVARITFAFGIGLLVIGIFMEKACVATQYLSPEATLEDYETCEDNVAGRAYALAFISIMRAPMLTFIDASRCCVKRTGGQDSDSDDEGGHGHGHGHAHADAKANSSQRPTAGSSASNHNAAKAAAEGSSKAAHAPAKGIQAAARVELSEPLIPRGESSGTLRSTASVSATVKVSSIASSQTASKEATSVVVAATRSGVN